MIWEVKNNLSETRDDGGRKPQTEHWQRRSNTSWQGRCYFSFDNRNSLNDIAFYVLQTEVNVVNIIKRKNLHMNGSAEVDRVASIMFIATSSLN